MKNNDQDFMNRYKIILIAGLLFGQLSVSGQVKSDSSVIENPFNSKLLLGFGFHGNLTTVTGNAMDFFAKPSLGLGLRMEYYPFSFLGFALGATYQQRGAGIQHTDIDKSPGNTDSTYIERLRFNSFEFPLSVLLRTPKDVVRGLRLSASVGIVPMINRNTTRIVHSVDDGLHLTTDESANFWKNDVAWQLSVGPDIVSGAGVFQVHFVYARGTKNVFQDPAQTGYNQSYGFRMSWLYRASKKHHK